MNPLQAQALLAEYDSALQVDVYAAIKVERQLGLFGFHYQDIRAGLVAATEGRDLMEALQQSFLDRGLQPPDIEHTIAGLFAQS